jgi:ankyrin repeat protein
MLTYTNDEKENSLHKACKLGHYRLVAKIVNKAAELNILQDLINCPDSRNLTPLFHLCMKIYEE